MFNPFVLWAFEETGKSPAPPPGLDQLFFLVIPLVFAYFFLLRPAFRQEKDRKALRSTLKKNDKVLTTGGIYGVVVAIAEKDDEITVKVDDNCRLKMTRAAIDRNLSNEEAAREAKNAKSQGERGASAP